MKEIAKMISKHSGMAVPDIEVELKEMIRDGHNGCAVVEKDGKQFVIFSDPGQGSVNDMCAKIEARKIWSIEVC